MAVQHGSTRFFAIGEDQVAGAAILRPRHRQYRMSWSRFAEAYRFHAYGEKAAGLTIEDVSEVVLPGPGDTFGEFYERNRRWVQLYEE